MTPSKRSFASISVLELAAGAIGLVLFAITVTASAQTPSAAPGGTPQTSVVPPAAATPATPPTAIGANGKPVIQAVQSQVLADPTTRLYARCTTGEEREAPGSAQATYKPNAGSVVMSEEAAKAKGFKAGAHKVSCK